MTRKLSIVRCPRAQFARRSLSYALTFLLVVASLVSRSAAWAESTVEFQVIVHPENPNTVLDREFLTDVYLKRVTRWGDGETVHPVDQRADAAVRRRFSNGVLRRSVAAVKRYWQQRIFSGRELPPPELDADEAVVGYVLKHRGAIGYVSGSAKIELAKPVAVH